jgi:hypothetical protein
VSLPSKTEIQRRTNRNETIEPQLEAEEVAQNSWALTFGYVYSQATRKFHA